MRARNITNNQISQPAPTSSAGSNKLATPLPQSFWLYSSSIASVALVFFGAPAAAEERLSASSTSDRYWQSVSKPLLHDVSIKKLAALAEPADSTEVLAPPTRSAAAVSVASTELVLPSSIAQANAPSAQPTEPSVAPPPTEPVPEAPSDLQPSEPPPGAPSDLQPSEPSAEPLPASTASQGWQFSLEPYFFAPFNVNADVTVSGRQTSLDLGLGDILNFDRAFNGGLRLRAQNNRLGFNLDGFYLYGRQSGRLGRTFASGSLLQFVQQTSPGRVGEFVQQFDPLLLQQALQIGQQIGLNTPIGVSADGTVSIRQILIDATVSYRVVDTSLNDSSDGTNFYPRLTIAPIAGVRANFLRQTIEVDDVRIAGRSVPQNALPPIDRNFRLSETLVEPLIGAQIDLALSERWALGVRGDVSGFNIGARQNFTWNLSLGAQYNVSQNFALQLAYRFNQFDFETGEGLRRSKLNLSQNGLLLNAVFRF